MPERWRSPMWSWCAKLPCDPALERRTVQPALPHAIVAEQLDSRVGERPPAQDRQQQLGGTTAQRGAALAMLMRPRDPALLDGDGPLAGFTQAGIGGVQVQGVALLERKRRPVGARLDLDPL